MSDFRKRYFTGIIDENNEEITCGPDIMAWSWDEAEEILDNMQREGKASPDIEVIGEFQYYTSSLIF